MAAPNNMTPTPSAPITVAQGYSTDAASEFWVRVAGSVFIVYEGVPLSLMQNIRQNSIPDTTIALQLAAYPRRVAAV